MTRENKNPDAIPGASLPDRKQTDKLKVEKTVAVILKYEKIDP